MKQENKGDKQRIRGHLEKERKKKNKLINKARKGSKKRVKVEKDEGKQEQERISKGLGSLMRRLSDRRWRGWDVQYIRLIIWSLIRGPLP